MINIRVFVALSLLVKKNDIFSVAATVSAFQRLERMEMFKFRYVYVIRQSEQVYLFIENIKTRSDLSDFHVTK